MLYVHLCTSMYAGALRGFHVPEGLQPALHSIHVSVTGTVMCQSASASMRTSAQYGHYHWALCWFRSLMCRCRLPERIALLERGLRDRAPFVRQAAAALCGSWLDACGGRVEELVKLLDVWQNAGVHNTRSKLTHTHTHTHTLCSTHVQTHIICPSNRCKGSACTKSKAREFKLCAVLLCSMLDQLVDSKQLCRIKLLSSDDTVNLRQPRPRFTAETAFIKCVCI